jgi:hypothetical protein
MPVNCNAFTSILLAAGLQMSQPAVAQDSAADLLEKARAEAAEIEQMKKVINEEPDQNVRLAAFQLMVESSNPAMREIAIESGLASADKLMQSAAFKAAIMELDRLHLVIRVDPEASDEIRKQSQAFIDNQGDQYIIPLDGKDPNAGTFKKGYWAGEIIGTHLTYTYGKSSGTLDLVDTDSLSGSILHNKSNKIHRFIAAGKIR